MAAFTITKEGKSDKTITAASCEVGEDGKYVFKNADGKAVVTVAGKNVDSLKRVDPPQSNSWNSFGYSDTYRRFVDPYYYDVR